MTWYFISSPAPFPNSISHTHSTPAPLVSLLLPRPAGPSPTFALTVPFAPHALAPDICKANSSSFKSRHRCRLNEGYPGHLVGNCTPIPLIAFSCFISFLHSNLIIF